MSISSAPADAGEADERLREAVVAADESTGRADAELPRDDGRPADRPMVLVERAALEAGAVAVADGDEVVKSAEPRAAKPGTAMTAIASSNRGDACEASDARHLGFSFDWPRTDSRC